MRTNKQITSEISKAKSFRVIGRNELEYHAMKGLLQEATSSTGNVDAFTLLESSFNLGYLRGMKHSEQTTFKDADLIPFEAPVQKAPEMLPEQKAYKVVKEMKQPDIELTAADKDRLRIITALYRMSDSDIAMLMNELEKL